MSWLTPEMALQDVIMANARLNNVLNEYIFAATDKRGCQLLLAFLR